MKISNSCSRNMKMRLVNDAGNQYLSFFRNTYPGEEKLYSLYEAAFAGGCKTFVKCGFCLTNGFVYPNDNYTFAGVAVMEGQIS